MQALSFAVHIPLVCFGIAFPAMVLFVEWLYLRTGDELYRTLAQALDEGDGRAVRRRGRDRHDPQLRDGPAVAGLHRHVRQRLRARLRDRGLLVLPRGDLHRDLRLRLGPAVAARALRQRHPDRDRRLHRLADGDLGQRLDEPPDRLPAAATARPSTCIPVEALFGNSYFWHELVHMYLAGYIVTGFLVAGAYAVARLRGRWGRYERTALAIPLDGRRARRAGAGARRRLDRPRGRASTSRPSSPRSRGSAQTTTGAPVHLLGWYTDGQVKYGIAIPRLLSLLAYHDPNATRRRASTRCRRTTVRRSTSCASPSRRWSGSARCSRCSASSSSPFAWRRKRLPESPWFYRALVLAGPLSVVALICGWVTTEVGRQPWVVYRVMRTAEAVTGAGGIPVGYATLALVYLAARGRGRLGPAPARPRSARSGTRRPPTEAPDRASLRAPAALRARSGSPSTPCSAAPTSAPASGS